MHAILRPGSSRLSKGHGAGNYLIDWAYGKPLIREISLPFPNGLVDQLEDRYLGMVEAASSNLAQSTSLFSNY
jgi:hypothetical protein